MLLGAIVSNTMEFDLTELRSAQGVLVRCSTPLLLMGANLREIVRGARSLLPSFAIGVLGTLFGAILGMILLGGWLKSASGGSSTDIAGLVSALAAKNIGGGMNCVGVTESAGVSSGVVALGLAADNLAAIIYFPLNSFMAGPGTADVEDRGKEVGKLGGFGGQELTRALFVALTVTSVSSALSGANAVALASLLSVALATLAPRTLERVKQPASALAEVFLGLFFASAGLLGGRVTGLEFSALAPVILLLLIVYGVHTIVLVLAGKVLRMTSVATSVVSNALIGGPATAAALARSKGSDPTAAILLGTLGNALATLVALLALLPTLKMCTL